MPRLFAGLELPAEIADQLSRLRTPMPGARWIEPSDYHVTLRFFGDVARPVEREIAAGLAAIEHTVFEMRLSEPGAFGGNDPHAVFAGIDGGEPLLALHRAVERVARDAGLKPEKHAFRPHVTLARLRHSRPDAVARFLQHHGGLASPPFLVTRLVLFSARALVGGGPYGKDEVFPLVGAGWHDGDDEDERDGPRRWSDRDRSRQ